MKYNHTLSAILRGKWLIDKSFADAHLPLVAAMLQGKPVSWNLEEKTAANTVKDGEIVMLEGNGSNISVYPEYFRYNQITGDFSATINLQGPILKYGDICSYGSVDYTTLINQLADMPNCKGLLINIDGPGGQAAGIASLGEAIQNFSTKKPVIGVIDDGMAASAHAWIATQTDELYVTQETDMVGSIGAYQTIADWNKQLAELYKLDVKDIYAPQSTDKNKTYYDALNGDEEGVKRGLSVLVDNFITSVENGRGGRLASDDWKTGKMYFASEALEIGLIDGIKSYNQVVDRLNELIAKNEQEIQEESNRITSQTKRHKMTHAKTLAAAKAEQLGVLEDGFLISSEALDNLEAHLSAQETAAATAAEDLRKANENLAAKTASLTASEQKVAELEAKVLELEGKESGDGTVITTDKDESVETAKTPSYKDPNSAINAAAAKALRRADNSVGKIK